MTTLNSEVGIATVLAGAILLAKFAPIAVRLI